MPMYAPPQPVAASVFTRLPERFRKPRRTAWGDVNAAGMELDCFLEGPSFDRAGNLYVTDIPFGRVFRVSPAGDWTLVTEYDGWPNGLKIHKDGRVFITDYKRGIVLLDPATGEVTPLIETARSESFKGVNDLFFAANGDLYFTDQGQTGLHDPTGRVYRHAADGRLDKLVDTVPSPNGLVMNHRENALYVAVTRGNCVWRLPLMADGHVSKVGLFIQMSGGHGGPDGMALDAEGGLVVCHIGTSVWRFDAVGRPTHVVDAGDDIFCTNIAFGVADPRSLYCVVSRASPRFGSGTILRAEMPVAGKPMFSHA
ncbi:MAG: SMP-30/gluconolactonase/LRE family protein [Rhodospirillales bacterium]|nr:MAG: SMP-30/gluconolactonase/LRE family protein [Rhodospirillales bacterium]